jgi:16S rRNA (guanine527-N7)-methyltransferase
MDESTLLKEYFPDLSEDKLQKFYTAAEMYKSWNEKINVISRKDIEHIYLHHFLHSLSIAKFISFKPGTRIIDVGTGGGFPGIPLAIFFPEAEFLLIDSIGKKITVANEIALALNLSNVKAIKSRAEEVDTSCDFIVSRAVASVAELIHWTQHLIVRGGKNSVRNGWIFLKGGDLKVEIEQIREPVIEINIDEYFTDTYFIEKKILYVNF